MFGTRESPGHGLALLALLIATAMAHAQAPANDDFANAQALTPSNGFTNLYVAASDTTAATGEAGEPAHGSAYSAQSSIWYRWTAPEDGTITISTAGSRGNTTHAVYSGAGVASLIQLARDPTSSSSTAVKPAVNVTAGTTYSIAVGALNGAQDRGVIQFQLNFISTVKITTQPADRIAAAGDAVTFTVTASGMSLTYQWFKNGRALPAATAAALTLQDVQISDGGSYHVTITGFGPSNTRISVTSTPAVLRGENPLPVITVQPKSSVVSAGESASLSVSATPPTAGSLQYQWRRNGFALPGATNATFTIAAASRSDTDVYEVRVNNGMSVTYSNRVRVDVQPSATPQGFALDPAFSVSLGMEGGVVSKVRRGADGKILIAGNFAHYDGATKPNLARLNADGSFDPSFVGANFDGAVNDAAIASDGKIIVAGSFTQIDEVRRSRVARLLRDGTPDAGFTLVPTLVVRAPSLVLVQADGKILLGGDFTATSGATTRANLVRLLPDGTLDVDYNPAPSAAINTLALQPDGKLIAGGAFTSIGGATQRYLARLNANGTNDPTFAVGTGPSGTVAVANLVADGHVLVAGAFNQFNGATTTGIVRLRPDGTRDAAFVGANASAFGNGNGSIPVANSVTDLAVLSDGKLVLVGSFQFLNGQFNVSGSYGLARLNADGSPDFSFSSDMPIAGGINSVAVMEDGRVLVGGDLRRFTFSRQLGGVAACSPAGKFDAAVRGTFTAGYVSRVVPVSGGKFLVRGEFTRVNGIPRSWLARINSDGSLDPDFNASLDDRVFDLAVQGDGRIVLTGAFTKVGETARNRVARVNANGTLDASFNFRPADLSSASNAFRVVALTEGRVLLASSSLSTGNGRLFARLQADGTLESGFASFLNSTASAGIFTTFAVLPDERILYANDGALTSGGVRPPVLGRLAQDGSSDPSFTPGVTPSGGGGIHSISVLPDGRILVGGTFTTYNTAPRNRLARLLPDGAIDATFTPNVSSTFGITQLQPARDDELYVFRTNSITVVQRTEPPLNQAFTRLLSTQLDTNFVMTFSAPTTGTASIIPSVAPLLLLDDGNFLFSVETATDGIVTRRSLMRTKAVSGVAILSQPVATTIAAGATLSLSVSAAGSPGLTYQWFRNNTPIDGAERATYLLTGAQAAAGGSYFVRISYPGGSVDSATVAATVNESAPVFPSVSATPNGAGSTLKAGTRYALTAPPLIAGSTPLSYQWSKDGVALPGETTAALFRAAWTPADTGAYRVTITNSLGSLTSFPVQQNVSDAPDWEWAQPQPQGNSLSLVTYANGRFVASSTRGAVLVSTNGLEWKTHPVAGSAPVGPIAYGNRSYVALTIFGGILRSSDAVTWTARTEADAGLSDGRTLSRVVFGEVGGGRFVAVGSQGLVRISTDGAAWTAGVLPSNEGSTGIAFGGGQFVVVTARGNVFASTDGVTWVRRAVLPEITAHLAYGAGVFATASLESSSIFTSPDGITWTRRNSGASSAAAILDLQYAGGEFLAMEATTAARYLSSTDGITWSEKAPTSGSLNASPSSITRGANVYVMTAGAPDLLLWSTDGLFWNRVAPAEGRSFRGIASNGTTAVAVGTAQPPIGPSLTALIRATYDGTTWFDRSTGTRNALNDIAYGANLFVAVGNAGEILVSPDGATWTARSSGVTATLRGVKYVNGRFLAAGDGVLLSSVDGAAWSRVSISPAPTLFQVAYGAGSYVAVGSSSSLLQSTDGTTWSTRASGGSSGFVDVVFAAGKFVAVGTTGTVATSPDGITWSTRQSNAPSLTSVAFASGRFVAPGTGASYYVSNDGETWTAAQHGSGQTLSDVVELRNRLIGVGNFGSILSQALPAPAGTTTPVIVAQPADQATRAGQAATLAVSTTDAPGTSYQWLKDGVSIPGATGASLTIASPQFADAGVYRCVVSTPAGAVTTAMATLRVDPGAQLSNLSVRTTLAAAQSLTVGFTVGGNGGGQWILVRAAGPALAPFGVVGTMADPKIELYSRGQKTAENDDWGVAAGSGGAAASDFARVGAFPFTSGSRDAAWLGPLVGGVSAVVSGTAPGAVLVECYDTGLTPSASTRLTNLSARNRAGPGTDVLIAGLTLSGSGTLRVLIRGVGPALADFGVSAPLADPKLEVFAANGVKIAENDDWSTFLSPVFADVGAFRLPSGSRDAALVVNLTAPGSYTVQISGPPGTSGEALVEVYELP